MSKGHFTPGKFVTIGSLVSELHYIALKLNQKYFIIRIVHNLENPNILGFICKEEGINSEVLSSSSAAINTIYGHVFGNKSKPKYLRTTMLDFHNPYMIQQMFNNVDFCPFTICLYSIKIFMVSIPDNNNYKGFAFSFMYKYKQKQNDQTNLLQNCDGVDLFGINHPLVQFKFKEQYERLFPKTYFWHRILYHWYNQKSTIIEIKSFICDVYNDNHEINPKSDIETILNLFSNGLLNTKLNSTIRNNKFENYEDTTISPKIIHAARKHYCKNGLGSNVNMSSYHIDKKTQLPVLYLKDKKRGLYLICNDYAYQPFEDLIKLVSNNIVDKKIKFNAALDELDDHGAVIIVDYKMCIFSATAREAKSEFFTVFNTINSRPHWIKIISGNGEPGEAKTTVNSHYAMIAHAIKRYV
ncbi:hypothetical protein C1646_765815 [Rhizophagus diaphanus]|nr:hypothetical protein C1646_765815 [Rhizophagus diaphanus] [Rhizophagus sp. MUCL 43196]